MNAEAIRSIGIVGAGLMGHGIAQVFGCQGYRVAITDAHRDTLNAVPGRIRRNLSTFLEPGDDSPK